MKVVFATSCLYFFYVVLGGGIFLLLEGRNEFGIREVIDRNKTSMFSDMRVILMENNYSETQIDDAAKNWNSEFVALYFDNESVTLSQVSWTYSNAFFFAFHLCSTIGYGNVSPSTVHGQMLAVFYALIGIPIHMLFFKQLGESFAQTYQETVYKIKGDQDSDFMKLLGDLGFFLPWTVVLFVIPAIVFMYTEDWNFLEGIYYSFITVTTIGLGDYVAGAAVENNVYYYLYRLVILCWMIYGLAFMGMIIDYLTHKYQQRILFTFKCDKEKYSCSIKRVYLDVEKLDIHFRLLRSEGVKHAFSMWTVRKGVRRAIGFQKSHLANLAILVERIQGELITLLQDYYDDDERHDEAPKDAFPVKVPKDAFPVKVPKDSFPPKQVPSDENESSA